jgi:hypothetical protein
VIVSKDSHALNADAPKFSTPSGRIIDSKLLHSTNANCQISFTMERNPS